MVAEESAVSSASALSNHSREGTSELKDRGNRKDTRHMSPSSSSSSIKPHSHLGLRPKPSDSLHSRIRSSVPRPKHVSKIETITSSKTVRPQISKSRDASYDSRENESVNGVSGNTSEIDDLLEHDPVKRVSTPKTAEQQQQEDDDREEYEMNTTDIGLYDEAVYDEYLGPIMGWIRRKLIQSLRWESPKLAQHQARVRSPRLDRYFVYTSLLGTHSFFLIFLPMAFWIGNGRFARGLVNVLAFGVYLSGVAKDALCIPRPYSPPVTRLVIGTTHLEYGFLSTHSTNSVSVAIYLYLWIAGLREQPDASPLLRSWACEIGLIYYVVSVVYGRVYAGMHSVMDCFTGSVLGAAITLVQWYSFDFIERMMLVEGWPVPVIVNSVGLMMVIVHPQPLDDCPCFEDSIAFLSVVMGITTGRWTSVRYGLLPNNDSPLATRGGLGKSLVEPAMDAIRDTFTSNSKETQTLYEMLIGTLISISMKVLIMLTGILGILITRVTVKIICRVILPPIFRFVEKTFGFLLPRRHYHSSAVVASSQQQANVTRPVHKRQPSSTGGDFFSNSSDPKETDSKHWKVDTRSAMQQTQDMVQSEGQVRPVRAERSKVKFTLGDGSEVPVPFTHPNTHLPGDDFSERIAGALSSEEKQRQQREIESSFRFPTRPEEREQQQQFESAVQHYDVDVLTKVFVYHAIGFASGCALPTIFDRLGWTS